MRFIHKTMHDKRGVGIVEIIVVVAIVATVFAGLFQLAALETRVQTIASQEAAAYALAREALEATRNVRDADWDAFAGLATATPYYPVLDAGAWTLAAADPGAINGYTRWVEFEDVYRDGSDNIAPSGTLDPNTEKVQARVSWTGSGDKTYTIEIDTYLTNWQAL